MGFLDAFFEGDWQDRIDEVGLDQHRAETIDVYEPEPYYEPAPVVPSVGMSQAEKNLLFYGGAEQRQRDLDRVTSVNEDLAMRAVGQTPARDISPIYDNVDMEYVHGVTMGSDVATDFIRAESDRRLGAIDVLAPFVVEDGSIRMRSQLEDLAKIEHDTKSSIETELERRSGVLGALFAQKNTVADSLRDAVQTNATTTKDQLVRNATTGIIDLGTIASQYINDLGTHADADSYIARMSDFMDAIVGAHATSQDIVDATMFDVNRFFDVVSQENQKALTDHLANDRMVGDEYVLRTSTAFGGIQDHVGDFVQSLDENDIEMAARLADITVEAEPYVPSMIEVEQLRAAGVSAAQIARAEKRFMTSPGVREFTYYHNEEGALIPEWDYNLLSESEKSEWYDPDRALGIFESDANPGDRVIVKGLAHRPDDDIRHRHNVYATEGTKEDLSAEVAASEAEYLSRVGSYGYHGTGWTGFDDKINYNKDRNLGRDVFVINPDSGDLDYADRIRNTARDDDGNLLYYTDNEIAQLDPTLAEPVSYLRKHQSAADKRARLVPISERVVTSIQTDLDEADTEKAKQIATDMGLSHPEYQTLQRENVENLRNIYNEKTGRVHSADAFGELLKSGEAADVLSAQDVDGAFSGAYKNVTGDEYDPIAHVVIRGVSDDPAATGPGHVYDMRSGRWVSVVEPGMSLIWETPTIAQQEKITEFESWLAQDPTDKRPYISAYTAMNDPHLTYPEDRHECRQFAADLVTNATRDGFGDVYAAVVDAPGGGGHAVVVLKVGDVYYAVNPPPEFFNPDGTSVSGEEAARVYGAYSTDNRLVPLTDIAAAANQTKLIKDTAYVLYEPQSDNPVSYEPVLRITPLTKGEEVPWYPEETGYYDERTYLHETGKLYGPEMFAEIELPPHPTEEELFQMRGETPETVIRPEVEKLPEKSLLDRVRIGYSATLGFLGIGKDDRQAITNEIVTPDTLVITQSPGVADPPTFAERLVTSAERVPYVGETLGDVARFGAGLVIPAEESGTDAGILDKTVVQPTYAVSEGPSGFAERVLTETPILRTMFKYSSLGMAETDDEKAYINDVFQKPITVYTPTDSGSQQLSAWTKEASVPGATLDDLTRVGSLPSRDAFKVWAKYVPPEHVVQVLEENPDFFRGARIDPDTDDVANIALINAGIAKHGDNFGEQARSLSDRGIVSYDPNVATVELTADGGVWKNSELHKFADGDTIITDYNQAEQSLLFTDNTDEQLSLLTRVESGASYEQIPEQYQENIGPRMLTGDEHNKRTGDYLLHVADFLTAADGLTGNRVVDAGIVIAGVTPVGWIAKGGKVVMKTIQIGDDLVPVGKLGISLIDNLPTGKHGANAWAEELIKLPGDQQLAELRRAQIELGPDTVRYSVDMIDDSILKRTVSDVQDRSFTIGGKTGAELDTMTPALFDAHTTRYAAEIGDLPDGVVPKLGVDASRTQAIQDVRSGVFQKSFVDNIFPDLTTDQQTAFRKVFSGTPYTVEDGAMINAALYTELPSSARSGYRETIKATKIRENILSTGRVDVDIIVNKETVGAGKVSPKSMYNVLSDNKNGGRNFGSHFWHATGGDELKGTAEMRNLVGRMGDNAVGEVVGILPGVNAPHANEIWRAYERAFGLGGVSHGDMIKMSPTELGNTVKNNVFELTEMPPLMGVAWREGFDAHQLGTINAAVIERITELQGLEGIRAVPEPEFLVGDIIPELTLYPKYVDVKPIVAARTERLKELAADLGVGKVPERPIPDVAVAEGVVKVTIPEVFVPSKVIAEEVVPVSRIGVLVPFESRVVDMLEVDPAASSRKIFDLLQKEGYPGSYSTLAKFVRTRRVLPKTADDVIKGADDVEQAAILHAADDISTDALKAQFNYNAAKGKITGADAARASSIIDVQHATGDAVTITPGTAVGKPVAFMDESVECIVKGVPTETPPTSASLAYAEASERTAKNTLQKSYDEFAKSIETGDFDAIDIERKRMNTAIGNAVSASDRRITIASGLGQDVGNSRLAAIDDVFDTVLHNIDQPLPGTHSGTWDEVLVDLQRRTDFSARWEQRLYQPDTTAFFTRLHPTDASEYVRMTEQRYGTSTARKAEQAYVKASAEWLAGTREGKLWVSGLSSQDASTINRMVTNGEIPRKQSLVDGYANVWERADKPRDMFDEMIVVGKQHVDEIADDVGKHAEETRHAETGANKADADAAKKQYDETSNSKAEAKLDQQKAYEELDNSVRSRDPNLIKQADEAVKGADNKVRVTHAAEEAAEETFEATGGSAARGKSLLDEIDKPFEALEKLLADKTISVERRLFLEKQLIRMQTPSKTLRGGTRNVSAGDRWVSRLNDPDVRAYFRTLSPDDAFRYSEHVGRRYGVDPAVKFGKAYVRESTTFMIESPRGQSFWHRIDRHGKNVINRVITEGGFPRDPRFFDEYLKLWGRSDVVGQKLLAEIFINQLTGIRAWAGRHPVATTVSAWAGINGAVGFSAFGLEEGFQTLFQFVMFTLEEDPERAALHFAEHLPKWALALDSWNSTMGRIFDVPVIGDLAKTLVAPGYYFGLYLNESAAGYIDNKLDALESRGWWCSQSECPTEYGYGRVRTTEEIRNIWLASPSTLLKNPSNVVGEFLNIDGSKINIHRPETWADALINCPYGTGEEGIAVLYWMWSQTEHTAVMSQILGFESPIVAMLETIRDSPVLYNKYRIIIDDLDSRGELPGGPTVHVPTVGIGVVEPTSVTDMADVTPSMIADVAALFGMTLPEAEEYIKNTLRGGMWHLAEQPDGSYKLESMVTADIGWAVPTRITVPTRISTKDHVSAPSDSGGAGGGENTAVEESTYVMKTSDETGVSVGDAFGTMSRTEQQTYRAAYTNSDGSLDVDALVADSDGWC